MYIYRERDFAIGIAIAIWTQIDTVMHLHHVPAVCRRLFLQCVQTPSHLLGYVWNMSSKLEQNNGRRSGSFRKYIKM